MDFDGLRFGVAWTSRIPQGREGEAHRKCRQGSVESLTYHAWTRTRQAHRTRTRLAGLWRWPQHDVRKRDNATVSQANQVLLADIDVSVI